MATGRAEKLKKKIVKPKRWWGYAILLHIIGSILPPLAVALSFGIGRDFWTNVVLTLCGFVPGGIHNFYVQHIRHNPNGRRKPKWAQTPAPRPVEGGVDSRGTHQSHDQGPALRSGGAPE